MEKVLETEKFVFNTTLEIEIEDFHNASEEVCVQRKLDYSKLCINYFVSVFPNGINEDTEGCLVVLSGADVYNGESQKELSYLKWIVSILDIEHNSRFPRYFDRHSFVEDPRHAKYFQKTFILNRADEFLSDGKLRLKYEIFFDLNKEEELRSMFVSGGVRLRDSFEIFLRSTPGLVSVTPAGIGILNDSFRIFDFTYQILTLPEYLNWPKPYKPYDVSSEISRLCSIFEENNKEHVWIFDTREDRIFLSLARRPGNLGNLLVKFSSVIKQCVNAPMKENFKKHIKLTNVDSQTFLIVLYFLESGKIPEYKFDIILEVYKFSHLYEMRNLQQKCADVMVEIFNTEHMLQELTRMAKLYSDEYLITLLKSHRPKYENIEKFVKDVRLDSDSYV